MIAIDIIAAYVAYHAHWPWHYCDLRGSSTHYHACNTLVVATDWAKLWLPAVHTEKGLDCCLVDTYTDEEQTFPIYTAYDPCDIGIEGYVERIVGQMLQAYWYMLYFCQCRRHQDFATAAGCYDPEVEFACKGRRYLIQSVSYRGLILLSETLGVAELEAGLPHHREKRTWIRDARG